MITCAKAKVQKLSGSTVALLHGDGTLEDVSVESLKGIGDANAANGKCSARPFTPTFLTYR